MSSLYAECRDTPRKVFDGETDRNARGNLSATDHLNSQLQAELPVFIKLRNFGGLMLNRRHHRAESDEVVICGALGVPNCSPPTWKRKLDSSNVQISEGGILSGTVARWFLSEESLRRSRDINYAGQSGNDMELTRYRSEQEICPPIFIGELMKI